MRPVLLVIVLAACGGNAVQLAPTSPSSSERTAVVAEPAAAEPAVERTLPLAGGANAVLWDASNAALYLTDSNADALLQWTDRGGLQTVAALPNTTSGVGLGGIVKRADGSFVIANFGFGNQGTLFALAADQSSRALTGLDGNRRRIGLAQDASGVLYSAYFVGGGKGAGGDMAGGSGKGPTGGGKGPTGGVATVTITDGAASETEIAGAATGAGLHKLVGLIATPSALFVSDQSQNIIFKIALPGYAVSEVAHVPAVDLLAVMPNGDLLTGGGPEISRITPTGTVTTIPITGGEQVRGLAYDPVGKRLFIIDHSRTVGVPDKLHILPLAN